MKRQYLNKTQKVSRGSLLGVIFYFGLLILFLQGCAAPTRYPVPENKVRSVRPLQLDTIRYFIKPWQPTESTTVISDSLAPIIEQHSSTGKVLTLLALSGGGDGGAFGAGLLYGWSEAGNRPEFDIVTGVSTGALMSPFAFLGSTGDESLRAVYTGISAENIYDVRGIGKMVSHRDAITDSKPLTQLLETYVDDKLLDKIREEHKRGRRLFVGTTHLDSGQLVIWDMGAIAVSGHSNAAQLFRDVLLASASIPIAFPPVYISIDSEGKQYDEMHVDGGLVNQVFGVEILVDILAKRNVSGDLIKASMYLIRNSELRTYWQPVPKKLIDIASRTVDTMINSQSIGDIYRNYVLAQHAGIDFFLTGIPETFDKSNHEAFDTDYMNELFEVGRSMGKSGGHWETELPGAKPFKNIDRIN